MRKLSLLIISTLFLAACDKPIAKYELNCSTWSYDVERRGIAKTLKVTAYKDYAILSIDGKDVKLSFDNKRSLESVKFYAAQIPNSNEVYGLRLYTEQDGSLRPFIGFESKNGTISNTRYANCEIIESGKK
jgi:hypothetical protein